MRINLQFFGGRGASGSNGNVVITRQAEPNKQGYAFYVTGSRTVLSNYDDEGNYHKVPIKQSEPIRQRFNTMEEAKKFAKKNKYKYLSF